MYFIFKIVLNNYKMDVLLGLDISTACIGLTLAENENGVLKILQVTHFRLKAPSKIKHIESLFYKSIYFENILNSYKNISNYGSDKLKINKVIIEEPLVSSNNSGTVSTLLRFNGMISLSVYRIFGIVPIFISSYEARKYAFPDLMAVRKYNKAGSVYPVNKIRKALKEGDIVLFGEYPWDCEKKLILWGKVSDMYPNIEWQYDKNNNLKKENFDASDSLICILGYINKSKCLNTEKPTVVEFNEIRCNNGILFKYKTKVGENEYNKIIEIN